MLSPDALLISTDRLRSSGHIIAAGGIWADGPSERISGSRGASHLVGPRCHGPLQPATATVQRPTDSRCTIRRVRWWHLERHLDMGWYGCVGHRYTIYRPKLPLNRKQYRKPWMIDTWFFLRKPWMINHDYPYGIWGYPIYIDKTMAVPAWFSGESCDKMGFVQVCDR